MADGEGAPGLPRHFWLRFVWWFVLATFGIAVVLLLFGTPLGNAVLLAPVIAGAAIAVGAAVERKSSKRAEG